MVSYLVDVIEKARKSGELSPEDLGDIKNNVPADIIANALTDAIFEIWFQIGDTAYNKNGYHQAVKLIEKHLQIT